MNGFAPGLDRRPLSSIFLGDSSLEIGMGGKAILGLSRLDYPSAKTVEAVNGGAVSAVHLDR